MKQLIKRGLDFVRGNLTIISSLALIFVVVGALFLNAYVTARGFQDNLDKTLRSKAVLAEDIIALAAQDYFANLPNSSSQLQEKLTQMQQRDGEIAQISLFVWDSNKNSYESVAQTNGDQASQDPQQKLVAENAKKFALSVDDAFAYLSNDGGQRYWSVVKSVRDGNGNVQGLLLMKLSLAESDALMEKTIVQVYFLSVGAVFIVLLLVFNHLRLFSFEVKAKKLEEIDKMKDDFISMASHELRSPLTAISGYSELLCDTLTKNKGEDVTKAQKKYLGNIDVSVARLKALVEDLLDVSRLEQNRLPINCQSMDCAPVIADMADEMKVMADEKKLKLINNVASLPLVLADPERVKQILVNLLSNAIKYTPSGKVEIQGKEDAKWVYITVADSGLGISSAQMAELFSKFYRVRTVETAQITGTGLGLWIAREIAQKMGGTLTVESIEGVGSHFTLKLKKA